jgi:hypothetical protein
MSDVLTTHGRRYLSMGGMSGGPVTGFAPDIAEGESVTCNVGRHFLPLPKPAHGEEVWLPEESVGGSLCVAGSVGQHSLPLPKPNHGEREWRPLFGQ